MIRSFQQEAGEKAVDDQEESETAAASYGPESEDYLCLERLVADLVSSSFLIHRETSLCNNATLGEEFIWCIGLCFLVIKGNYQICTSYGLGCL